MYTNPHPVIYYLRSYISLIRLAKKKKNYNRVTKHCWRGYNWNNLNKRQSVSQESVKITNAHTLTLHRESNGIPENPILGIH